ncbi:MAG: 30S ribosomal protein S20 [Clostridia bacterium]|nr:30S ribosomal protein S20 [Clostridia bacterium]MBQ9988458.1 30S ribosomal protein S20 [Clostridia bacterium]
MPNIKSAIKRVKVEDKKNLRNRVIKSRMKTSIKNFDAAKAGDENLEALYRNAVSMVDRAASKGVIHDNARDRKKAQLAKAFAAKKA